MIEPTKENECLIDDRIKTAVARLKAAIEIHRPIAVFGLFSGGHDSLSATYVATQVPDITAVVHINTGIGVQATRQFVYDTCAARGWKLIELKAAENTNAKGEPDPQVYRQIILKYGFPGPAGHGMMYARLKERALRRLARMYGADVRKGRRIILVSGCRSQESDRRMGTVEEVQVMGRSIWVAPIHDWSKLNTTQLIEHADLRRNVVVDLVHKSGECLCGAFGKPGELEEYALWPETRPVYDEIKALEAEAKAAGVHCVWGTRPPRACRSKATPGPLCWSCTKAEANANAMPAPV